MYTFRILLLTSLVMFFTTYVNANAVNMAPIITYLLSDTSSPLANADVDQNVNTTSTVTLNGSLSTDENSDVLTYAWSITSTPSGSNATLSDETIVNPTFIADLDGAYILSLVVNNGDIDSAADTVTINATTANSGVLDSSFSSDGLVTHDNAAGGSDADGGNDIAVDTFGNIYVTGFSTNSSGNRDMIIWKYTSSGELDTTFNGIGFVLHNNAAGGDNDDEGSSITLDSFGNIYVTGKSSYSFSSTKMIIWKYKPNGSLDSSFNSDGIAISSTYNNSNGNSILLDSNNNIYVTGRAWDNDGDMAIWKYKPDGSLDSNFGGDGIVYSGVLNSFEEGNSIVLDPDENIYVTGGQQASGANDRTMNIWKYKPDGTLDLSFSGDGIINQDSSNSIPSVSDGHSIDIDSFGNIYVAGYSVIDGKYSMLIWKYTNNGILDTSFSGDGIIMYSNGSTRKYTLAINHLNEIYVLGIINSNSTVVKYTSNADLDTSFNDNGIMKSNAGYGSITLDLSRKIYITGGYSYMLTAKYK